MRRKLNTGRQGSERNKNLRIKSVVRKQNLNKDKTKLFINEVDQTIKIRNLPSRNDHTSSEDSESSVESSVESSSEGEQKWPDNEPNEHVESDEPAKSDKLAEPVNLAKLDIHAESNQNQEDVTRCNNYE